MTRPYLLTDSTWEEIGATRYEVAVLPWGATEAHNRHLPYATDTIQSAAIAAESARLAWDRGAKVLVLPTVPFGVQTGQRDIPFCLNLNPSSQLALLGDLLRSIEPHGVRKLVILNGHGGNDFKQIIRELQPATGLLLCQVNWYGVLDGREFFSVPGDHAGEMETSLIQFLTPALARPLDRAGPGIEREAAVQAFREKWAWTPRQWTRVTDDTGVGDPAAATAAKGERYFTAVTAKLADFLVELAAVEPDRFYRDPR